MSEWSHLPNAVHIDRILAHVKTNPEKWSTAWNAAWNATAWNATARNAWHAAWGASMALIAYPDCAYMLNMSPEQIKMYAHLDVKGAWLLYPAAIAMEKEYV